jgi:hypothetical protein
MPVHAASLPRPVEYPAGVGRLEVLPAAAAGLLWLAVQAAWLEHDRWAPSGAWWFALCVGLVWVAVLVWRLQYPIQGRLGWLVDDAGRGGEWRWHSEAYRHGTPVTRIEWALDLQVAVLVRLHNAAGAGWWVWLHRRADPARWDDLRRALLASRRAAAVPV